VTIGDEITNVLIEQLAAVDVRRVAQTSNRLSVEEMWSIDDALALVVGLH